MKETDIDTSDDVNSICIQFEKVPWFFAYKNLDSKFLFCNESLLHYVGYNSLEKIKYKCDHDFQWCDYADHYRNHELQVIENNSYCMMYPGCDLDGNYIIMLSSKYPHFNEKKEVVGLICHAQVIQDKRLLEFSNFLQRTEPSCVLKSYSIKNNNAGNIQLTQRESECLFYFLRGKTIKIIGKLLDISPRTVEIYIEQLKCKFNCSTKSDLIYTAIQQGFIYNVPVSLLKSNTLGKVSSTD